MRRVGISAGLIGVLAPLLLLPGSLQAAITTRWRLQDTAKAPVLVVGRVLGVEKGVRDAEVSLKQRRDVFDMTAEIQVLRSFTLGGATIAANRIRVHFLWFPHTGVDLPLPGFETDQVVIVPLQENRNPATEVWRMTSEAGEDLILPTAALLPDEGPLPMTSAQFLFREIANALSRGTPAEMAGMGRYLAAQDMPGTEEDLAGGLMPLLEPILGADRQGWAKVTTNVMAGKGIPRPTIADLFAGKVQPFERSMLLVQATLRKLGQSPETDALLIRTWIANAPWHAWGSGMSLVEYAKHPVATETLRRALTDDVPGSSGIAWTLVRNGNREVLPEALARALKVADRPAGDPGDLQGAAMLLRDFGSDQDLDQLAALVRKYQTLDRNFYGMLWQYATEAGNPRETRVLAVVLGDRSIVPHSSTEGFRVCDYALENLERAVGQTFGAGDAAIARAQAWLRSQGIRN
jgi:hypothetical protein